MHITKPHCTCLLLSDREHAVRWRKSRRGEKWEIRSLVERLRHSNTRICPSPPRPPAERLPPTDRGPLIQWFSIGFACACIAGSIAPLAKCDGSRATSRIGLAPRRTRREDHEREEHDRTCGGGRRCCSRRVPLGGVPAPEARRRRGHAGGGEDPVNRRRPAGC